MQWRRMGIGGVAPFVLNFGTDGGKKMASPSGHFTPWNTAPGEKNVKQICLFSHPEGVGT
jgi:hypothetical protein